MKTVEMIIKIPEETRARLALGAPYMQDIQSVCYAINEGKILPNERGRLIDADEAKKKIEKFWTEQRGFSLVDVMDVIDLKTETYVRPDW